MTGFKRYRKLSPEGQQDWALSTTAESPAQSRWLEAPMAAAQSKAGRIQWLVGLCSLKTLPSSNEPSVYTFSISHQQNYASSTISLLLVSSSSSSGGRWGLGPSGLGPQLELNPVQEAACPRVSLEKAQHPCSHGNTADNRLSEPRASQQAALSWFHPSWRRLLRAQILTFLNLRSPAEDGHEETEWVNWPVNQLSSSET